MRSPLPGESKCDDLLATWYDVEAIFFSYGEIRGPAHNDHRWSSYLNVNDLCRIMEHELEFESVKETHHTISGNRIVELGYVIDKILLIQAQHLQQCTLARVQFHKEIRRGTGLVSCIELKCCACDKVFTFTTEDAKKNVINMGVVWGTLASGSSYLHTKELLSCIDIPTMPEKMFSEYEEFLSEKFYIIYVGDSTQNGPLVCFDYDDEVYNMLTSTRGVFLWRAE
ncbi:hypothetical protein NQ315_008238 [Exocentrus adspersus]|uniref:Mutator-like transposase domain-containing protein n=1 Tax=Exocentrus adspersus TaxID=1586481 RepID=A0AAV8VN63_9CUCU|nr:hypothetical protein NQ315_008238 [Exocentrus adspersus]